MPLNAQPRPQDRFFVILAILSFIADVYAIYQLVASLTVINFWSWRWSISIVFIAILALAGLGFLILGGSEEVAKFMVLMYGVFYTFASLATYLYWGFQQADKGVRLGDYLGFLMLFAISTGAGLLGIAYHDLGHLRYPSYGYAASNLAFMFMLTNEYVLNGSPFGLWKFVGELFILLLGIILVLVLYDEST